MTLLKKLLMVIKISNLDGLWRKNFKQFWKQLNTENLQALTKFLLKNRRQWNFTYFFDYTMFNVKKYNREMDERLHPPPL